VVNLIQLPLCIIFCYISVHVLDFGVAGLGVVMSLLHILDMILLVLIIKWKGIMTDIPLCSGYTEFFP
jgi:Na+-driven multidrug efflux pump